MRNKISIYFITFLFFILLASSISSGYSVGYNPFPFVFLIFLIPIAIYAVLFAIAYWIYKDANKRGLNGLLWGIIAFFGGLIGILLYFVLRDNLKPDTPDRICPNCGRSIPMQANLCPYCGKKFESYL